MRARLVTGDSGRVGALPSQVAALEDGDIDAIISQNPCGMGVQGADDAVALGKGTHGHAAGRRQPSERRHAVGVAGRVGEDNLSDMLAADATDVVIGRLFLITTPSSKETPE